MTEKIPLGKPLYGDRSRIALSFPYLEYVIQNQCHSHCLYHRLWLMELCWSGERIGGRV